jgi:hypothetical protein
MKLVKKKRKSAGSNRFVMKQVGIYWINKTLFNVIVYIKGKGKEFLQLFRYVTEHCGQWSRTGWLQLMKHVLKLCQRCY